MEKPDVSIICCTQWKNHKGVENGNEQWRGIRSLGTAGQARPEVKATCIVLICYAYPEMNAWKLVHYKPPFDSVRNLSKLLGTTQAILHVAYTACLITFPSTFSFWDDSPIGGRSSLTAWAHGVNTQMGAPLLSHNASSSPKNTIFHLLCSYPSKDYGSAGLSKGSCDRLGSQNSTNSMEYEYLWLPISPKVRKHQDTVPRVVKGLWRLKKKVVWATVFRRQPNFNS